jgi:hypothetical protein
MKEEIPSKVQDERGDSFKGSADTKAIWDENYQTLFANSTVRASLHTQFSPEFGLDVDATAKPAIQAFTGAMAAGSPGSPLAFTVPLEAKAKIYYSPQEAFFRQLIFSVKGGGEPMYGTLPIDNVSTSLTLNGLFTPIIDVGANYSGNWNGQETQKASLNISINPADWLKFTVDAGIENNPAIKKNWEYLVKIGAGLKF